MSHFSSSLFIFVACLLVSIASTGTDICPEDQCLWKGYTFYKGESYTPLGDCIVLNCQGNNSFTALGCPLIFVDVKAGWTLTGEDLSKTYPYCCPQPVPPPSATSAPEPCVVDGVVYQVGQQRDIPGYCLFNVCAGNNQWTQAACGLIAMPEGSVLIPEDPSKPFPECCAKAVVLQEDECIFKDIIIKKGEPYTPLGECIIVNCGGNNSYTALGCPKIFVNESNGWTLSDEDLTKTYPDCCPQPIPPPTTTSDSCVVGGKVYQVGQQCNIPGYCQYNVCAGNNKWTQQPCAEIDVPRGWVYIPENKHKPYPECCAKAVPP